ncbi:MAG: hypothetical protein WD009_02835 [Phycisphaeraceae bacterium]
MSLSTMLATHKVSPRVAQALMRHSDPRLTANTYTDEKLLPLAAELQGVPAIGGGDAAAGPGPAAAQDIQAVVALLSADERRALLRMLARPQAQ